MLGLETSNHKVVLLNIFRWCKEHGITLLVTASSGLITEYDSYFKEYAADCVISLEQIIHNNFMTRFVRVVKMRGSSHGTNRYPFLVTDTDVSILPVTYTVLNEQKNVSHIATGIPVLDRLFGGKGYIEGSSIMISGSAGSCKSILAATLAESAVKQHKKVLYLSFEESAINFIHNIKSAGINLEALMACNMFVMHSPHTIEMSLEEHLIKMIKIIDQVKPDLLILDPFTALLDIDDSSQVKSFLVRLVSYTKLLKITFIFTQFLQSHARAKNIIETSSLVDTWIKLQLVESNGEFNRTLHLIKSRGNAVSTQIKEFYVTDQGIKIQDPYVGEGGMIFGSRKSEKIAIDKKRKSSLEEQLLYINNQINLIQSMIQKEGAEKQIENSTTLFELFEKKHATEIALDQIKIINIANVKSRE